MYEYMTMGLLVSLPHIYLNRKYSFLWIFCIVAFCCILWPIVVVHALLLCLEWRDD